MRVLALCALVFAAGCAPVKSLEQLEAEAVVSGDWSAVELRERTLALRGERSNLDCPTGYIEFCQKIGRNQRCGCATRQRMDEFFAGR